MKPISILYVDDDPDIRTIVELALHLDPMFCVTSVDCGRAALDQLLGEHRPDAVMLDVMMPGMDGPAVLANIRMQAAFRDMPVIFLTAKGRPSDLQRYMRAGANGVIVKPFDPLDLARQIRQILHCDP